MAAYTAQLGNGVSASLSFEEPRRQVVANTSVCGTGYLSSIGKRHAGLTVLERSGQSPVA